MQFIYLSLLGLATLPTTLLAAPATTATTVANSEITLRPRHHHHHHRHHMPSATPYPASDPAFTTDVQKAEAGMRRAREEMEEARAHYRLVKKQGKANVNNAIQSHASKDDLRMIMQQADEERYAAKRAYRFAKKKAREAERKVQAVEGPDYFPSL